MSLELTFTQECHGSARAAPQIGIYFSPKKFCIICLVSQKHLPQAVLPISNRSQAVPPAPQQKHKQECECLDVTVTPAYLGREEGQTQRLRLLLLSVVDVSR